MAIQDTINQLLSGQKYASPGQLDFGAYINQNNDVLQEYYNLQKTADGRALLASYGDSTPEQFGETHWGMYGQGEGRTPTYKAGTATYTPDYQKGLSLSQALANARNYANSQGIDYDKYGNIIEDRLAQILQYIPEGADPASYISPNFGESVLSGEQSRMRNTYSRNLGANQAFAPLNSSILDDTISKILGEQETSANEFLDRGLKRGQFNDAGVAAGKSKLESAKAAARAKLATKGMDLLSGYNTQLLDLRKQAMDAAAAYKLGDYDPTEFYSQQANAIRQNAINNASGQLYADIGDTPLIDLESLRGSVGQAQGATNLKDMDVLEGLAKRKKASDIGRGLGSEGAF